ncbi:MAG: beta-propeller domain-containing protein [Haloarculaceae archaeon]
MPRDRSLAVVLVALLVGAGVGGALALGALAPAAPGTGDGPAAADQPRTTDSSPDSFDDPSSSDPFDDDPSPEVSRFDTRAAYRAYVRAGQERAGGALVPFRMGPRVGLTAEPQAESDAVATRDGDGDGGGAAPSADAPDRIGTTNVQVAGLDEPDLVKSGEREFYYSPMGSTPIVEPRPADDVEGTTPPRREGDTHVVGVGDPATPEYLATIEEQGRLLRSGDTLVLLAGDHLQAYDVSEPGSPSKTWSQSLNASLVSARQQDGTLYLVTRTRVQPGGPCPIEPLAGEASVACTDVYHPDSQVTVDATYTAISIDAASGDVGDTVSFVGTARNSIVYISDDAIYATYTEVASSEEVLATYALSQAALPESVRDRIREIRSYDISARSSVREIRRAIENYWQSLPSSEADERREAFWTGYQAALADHQRDLVRTGVVRVAIEGSSLAVDAVGEVPGNALNQFSLSQYNGTLRLTTTVPSAGDARSENDLYVLDAASLDVRGEVQGMGLNERVYSVRYVEDTAYVVTFRRIDPFHVVDLSDPADPTVAGKLKLPGFSSYLHPIDEDQVLGVGEEEGRVKAVLFDVSDPSDPTVGDDFLPEARWSAIADTHHAFTIDRKHGVFFLPAGTEAYIVDYTDGDLAVERSIRTDGETLRARYVDDYLYVFGRSGITVLDETSWERETTVPLPE